MYVVMSVWGTELNETSVTDPHLMTLGRRMSQHAARTRHFYFLKWHSIVPKWLSAVLKWHSIVPHATPYRASCRAR